MAKEKEDSGRPLKDNSELDESSLFYTDLMPLLVSFQTENMCQW